VRSFTGNLKSGVWKEWYELQAREERRYVNGKLDGPRKKWYSNGKLKEEGNYKEGKENGRWTYYLEDGAIETSYDIKGNFLSRINVDD
jgi:antitoxin component YwqK of YwqJK toxin-antitoxin module